MAHFSIALSGTHWETLFSWSNKTEVQRNSLLSRGARVTVISLIASHQAVQQHEPQQWDIVSDAFQSTAILV